MCDPEKELPVGHSRTLMGAPDERKNTELPKSMGIDLVVRIARGKGGAGWRGAKGGEHWDNCNSVNNKI